MNIAMLLAENVDWPDRMRLGPGALGVWTEDERDAANENRFIDRAVIETAARGRRRVSPDEGRLAVFGQGRLVLAQVDGTLPVRLAQAADMSAEKACRALNERIARVRRWLYDLHEATLSGGVDMLLEVAVRMTGLSLILFDGAFDLAAYARGPNERSARFEETVERRQAVEVSAEHQREYRRLMEQRPQGFATMYDEPGGSTPVWSQPVDAGVETFRLHVMGARESDVGTIAVARAVASELGCVLRHPTSGSVRAFHADFVEELVSQAHPPADADARREFFGWADETDWVAARVESLDRFFPQAKWRAIASELERLVPRAHATPIEDGAALVASSQSIDSSRSVLEDFCERQRCLVCWGDPVPSLGDAHASYEEGVRGTGFMHDPNAVGAPPFARPFDECRHGLLLSALADLARSVDVVPRRLAAVRAHDTGRGGSYELTMREYLAQDRSKAPTCAALSIHRTTLDYRLSRLREEFGIDLDDPRTAELMRLVFAAGA